MYGKEIPIRSLIHYTYPHLWPLKNGPKHGDGDHFNKRCYGQKSCLETDNDGNAYNVAIGNAAGKHLEEGEKNTIVGHGSVQSASGNKLDGDSNSTFGYASGYGFRIFVSLSPSSSYI